MSAGGQPPPSPLHKKILELEATLRRFNILDSGRKKEKPKEGCMTSPLPRRPMPMPMQLGTIGGGEGSPHITLNFAPNSAQNGGLQDFVRRRRPYEWHQNGILVGQPNRQSDSAEAQRRFEEMMKQNGVLRIHGMEIKAEPKDLELLGELGHGTCGHVVKMRLRHTGQVIAVKQMRRTGNKEENKRVIMDLDVVLKSHDCPHIVQCYGCFITDSDVWICMELMDTCLEKLGKRLNGPIPEDILGKMAVSIVKALNYLKEKQGIIHRDVKPSNMLLDSNGTIKLCDFGISGRLVDSKAKTRGQGCAAYMAPERIEPPDKDRPDYDTRADVWSLGISLVELATGRCPYANSSTDFEVLARILEDDPPLLAPDKGFSTMFCTFVRDCLTKDFHKRPKYRKLLEHPFISHYEKAEVDVASWYKQVMQRTPSFPSVPSVPDANRNFAISN